MQAAIDRGMGVAPSRERPVVTVLPPAVPTPARVDPPHVAGPSPLNRVAGWGADVLWACLRWVTRLPLRASRRLSILAISLLLLITINIPIVSNALLGQVIDVVPWSATTVQTDGLNLRASPGTDGEIRSALGFDLEVSITGLPQRRDGITWWPVIADGQRGWVAGEYLDETRLMWAVQAPGGLRDAAGNLLGIVIP